MGQQRSLGVYAARPESARSLALRNSSLVNGCKIGLDRSATRNAGGAPGLRACAGSLITGPGPRAGGRNSCPSAIHPVLLSGAKLGVRSAAPTGHDAAGAQHAKSAIHNARLDDIFIPTPATCGPRLA